MCFSEGCRVPYAFAVHKQKAPRHQPKSSEKFEAAGGVSDGGNNLTATIIVSASFLLLLITVYSSPEIFQHFFIASPRFDWL